MDYFEKRKVLLTMVNAIEITDNNFENEIIKSGIPAIVDFWAEWCMPCRTMLPVIDEVANEFIGKIKVGKINIDENISTATDLTVMNIPTLLFFKDGKEVGRVTRVVQKRELIEKISEFFNE